MACAVTQVIISLEIRKMMATKQYIRVVNADAAFANVTTVDGMVCNLQVQ